jgi:NAD(P)-dependent dehydrogenase (short-subunit alcohol dehydrogenase family)
MQQALVIGASGGIGTALVAALRAQSYSVTEVSRRANGLDLTNDASIARVLGGLTGPFDTVIVATGALELDGVGPEKSLRGLTASALQNQFALNAMGPILALKHALPLMPRDRPARFAALSARVGSIGDNALGGWYSYRAAKAALNQLLHTAAVEVARSHPKAVIAALHPGHVATPLSLKYGGALPAVTVDEAAQNILAVLDGLTPAMTGGFYDWKGDIIPW